MRQNVRFEVHQGLRVSLSVLEKPCMDDLSYEVRKSEKPVNRFIFLNCRVFVEPPRQFSLSYSNLAGSITLDRVKFINLFFSAKPSITLERPDTTRTSVEQNNRDTFP